MEKDLQDYLDRLDTAIESVMMNEMTNTIQAEIKAHAETDVYSYKPRFESRRKENGGIIDRDNLDAKYEFQTRTLTVTEEAPFQQLFGGERPTYTSLGDVIESGNEAFYMKRAGKRPFMQNAERDIGNKTADKVLTAGLKSRGL